MLDVNYGGNRGVNASPLVVLACMEASRELPVSKIRKTGEGSVFWGWVDLEIQGSISDTLGLSCLLNF